ncbi:hypothetical protein [Porphyromonas levii]|uniref:hypothetical protein n=1 Tax=Porphyromonas levii TaxID=28114 RepID=UPI00200B4278|nr:hypothetical protein [Porphyromonas levii]
MAQDIVRTKNNYEFELKAGLNFLGGTAPMGLPVEIRSIDGYKPKFGGSFEGLPPDGLGSDMAMLSGVSPLVSVSKTAG